jgi:hypothetical protein
MTGDGKGDGNGKTIDGEETNLEHCQDIIIMNRAE